MTYDEIIKTLHSLANPETVSFKERKFGVKSVNTLGIYQKDLNEIIKETIPEKKLAIQLFESGIYEGRVLCAKLFPPKELTEDLMEQWVKTFENWEICDTFSMKLFARSDFALSKIKEWINREPEFEKRAGFTTMAAYCMADKKAPNYIYEEFLSDIKSHSGDNRLYVKKAVNWALRSVGKRNIDLNKMAISTAKQILELPDKSAKWIAKDAIKELESDSVNILDYPRSIYRPTKKGA
ncbi:MAG: DNA alkylation repair protein [Melioribacteraceae bacterium]|nr:DNA alkylation repair protein [Melioribacteraceae bacterium]MCF8262955.1 DNA alkylation repair protein [Melioribacteraceae bacterium]MCF8430612.1 DNA alkylation repair protein [Melioribacteraceae bacterium]